MSTPRYLVTGGAGFIGSNIVAALVAAGERVRVLDNLATGMWENLDGISPSSAIERIEGDIRDPEAVAKAAAGVEVVFHEAALGSVPRSVEDPVTSDAVNVGGTVTVLDVSRRVGVRRVVFAASSSAYGETPVLPKREDMQPMPLSPYAVTKLACESYCRVFSSIYGLETMCLRYFNVFGPHQTPEGPYAAAIPRFVDAALAEKPIRIFGDGEQTRDFCFVDNAVRANLLAAGSPRKLAGEVVNIAGERRVSLNALCVEIGRVLGRTLAVEHGPPRPGDVRHSLADVSLAREILGYEPSVRWEDGIAPTVAYLEALRASGPAEAARRAAERRAQSAQENAVRTGAATNVVALFR
ncbi:NAD-dependent epimerase/dehydratase family protein [Polyangium sp. 6x1]|uniref:NAD-dependent epimerase/dehydratase family protein n=1 Tax=Polyangium sp. 6x1 TaxID=3042689 RepID=UPI002482FA99|nr:NAD-dependent epimerase/dehydratase family protein [Polyangium sp. 6x1]MDI1444842.1 NAD-dependent epimerase/dehydratase family protein [Polyangium sp. 6x1]